MQTKSIDHCNLTFHHNQSRNQPHSGY
ncbi:uncharacterized protein METZ01_LOCUS331032, partial [marine metagenome]